MKCAYCRSEIDFLAEVCPVCRRDLGLVRKLQTRVEELQRKVELLSHAGAPSAAIAEGTPSAADVAVVHSQAERAIGLRPWLLWSAALLTLLLAHALIVMAFDLHTLWLRVATLFIPIPFAFVVARSTHRRFVLNLAISIVIALLAVTGMSAMVAATDSVPLFPSGRRDVVEWLQYVISIFASFATGLLLGGNLWDKVLSPTQTMMPLARWLLKDPHITPDALHRKTETARAVVTTISAICTTVVSIATGLQHVLAK